MTDRRILARRFETERPRLLAIAVRLLGSVPDAEDAVQETWLRLERIDASEIENLEAWLTTVVSRVSLDLLRAPRRTREQGILAAKARTCLLAGRAVARRAGRRRRGSRGSH